MKPELTLELKERFFAQYWGQKVFQSPQTGVLTKRLQRCFPELARIQGGFLWLRDMANISINENIELIKILTPELTDEEIDECINGEMTLEAAFTMMDAEIGDNKISPVSIDVAYSYLRSLNIALPFSGYSIDEFREAGWVKLVDQ